MVERWQWLLMSKDNHSFVSHFLFRISAWQVDFSLCHSHLWMTSAHYFVRSSCSAEQDLGLIVNHSVTKEPFHFESFKFAVNRWPLLSKKFWSVNVIRKFSKCCGDGAVCLRVCNSTLCACMAHLILWEWSAASLFSDTNISCGEVFWSDFFFNL